MNAARRKTIEKARDLLKEAAALLEEARAGEEEYRDNMPDSIRDGEKGDRAEEVENNLAEAIDAIENVEGELEEAIS